MKASIPPRCRIARCGSASVRTCVSLSSPERTKRTYIKRCLASTKDQRCPSHFGLRSSTFAVTSEHEHLVVVLVSSMIVSQRRDAQLDTSFSHTRQEKRCLLSPHLFCPCSERRSPARCTEYRCRSPSNRWSCFWRNPHWRRHSSNSQVLATR